MSTDGWKASIDGMLAHIARRVAELLERGDTAEEVARLQAFAAELRGRRE